LTLNFAIVACGDVGAKSTRSPRKDSDEKEPTPVTSEEAAGDPQGEAEIMKILENMEKSRKKWFRNSNKLWSPEEAFVPLMELFVAWTPAMYRKYTDLGFKNALSVDQREKMATGYSTMVYVRAFFGNRKTILNSEAIKIVDLDGYMTWAETLKEGEYPHMLEWKPFEDTVFRNIPDM